MRTKALARFCYATVPGLAAARFAVKDAAAPYFSKPEYDGAMWLSIGDGLIVDVGANRGQSIAAFRRLAPQSQIIAFEPEPRSAGRLRSRHASDATVKICHCALGARRGTITFFIPSYGHWDCDGMSATDHAEATEWLRDPGRMYRFDETKLSVGTHLVACDTLDSYKLTPRLIKLHAQGAELDILQGAQQTIRQHRPALMCAFPTSQVDGLLMAWGYRPHVYSRKHFAPGIADRHITFTWYLTDSHLTELATRGVAHVRTEQRAQAI